MNKKALSFIIIGFFFITIIPVGNTQITSKTINLSGDLYVTSIDPIQVIDDADTLVTQKDTVIRVTVESTFTEEVKADIEFIYDFGTKTYVEDGPGVSGITFTTGTNTIYAPGGPTIPTHPSPWYTTSVIRWTNIGFDSLLKAEVDPDNRVEETDETNNEISNPPIRVADAPLVKVLYVPIAFPGDEDWRVSMSTIYDQKDFMLKTYPLAEMDLNFHEGPLWRFSVSPSGSGTVLKNWLYEVVVYPIACTTRMMGFNRVIICTKLYGSGAGTAIGMGRTPQIREPVIVSNYMPKDNLVAHELGHTYYLWHPHDLGPAVYTDECYDVDDQDYGQIKNTLMSYRSEPLWIDKGRYDNNPKKQILPGTYYYAGDPEIGIEPKDKYFSVSTWSWNLMDQLTEDPPTYSCIMVNGLLRDDGSIKLNHSWYKIEAVPDVPQQVLKGSQNEQYYYIIFLNDNQQIISQFPFKASFNIVIHDDLTDELENAISDTIPFVFNIQEVEGTRFIEIQDADGLVLAEREVTQNSPNVQVLYPNGGEKFKVGDKINIEWEGTDQDQDTLRYTLAYSNDNGQNWIPIAFDTKETSLEWNTFGLSKGKYRIKVIASDGVNVGEDISDGDFTLPRIKEKIHLSQFKILERLLKQFLVLEQIPIYQRLLNLFS